MLEQVDQPLCSAGEEEASGEIPPVAARFLANMNHELRTPLNAILSLSGVLLRDAAANLTKEHLQYVDIIHRNGQRLFAMITDIIELSRLESGTVRWNQTVMDLKGALKGTLSRMEEACRAKGVDLQTTGLDALPSFRGDEARIRMLIKSLLDHAVAFTNTGRVEFRAAFQKDRLHMEIQDSGGEIPDAELIRLFEPFCRRTADNESPVEHTGLELAIARRIAQAMRGTLRASPNPRGGVCFLLTIPVLCTAPPKESQAPDLCVSKESCESNTAESSLRPGDIPARKGWATDDHRPRVLVIDDHPDSLLTVQALLQDQTLVDTASTGKEGLQQARALLPDLILLDLSLPDLPGLQVAGMLKTDCRTEHIPIVVLTGHDAIDHQQQAAEAGCRGFLSKPVCVEALRGIVAELTTSIHEEGKKCP